MIRRTGVAAAALALVGGAAPALAYDFNLHLRTTGQGYQVRRFAPGGTDELLNRRRLTQYIDLRVFDLSPQSWRGEEGDRNDLSVALSMRFDSDFGMFMLGRPRGTNEIRELQQNQLDVLTAYVAGRDILGRLDFQLGRQVHFDLADFYAFDGGHAELRLPARLTAEAFGGAQVLGDLPLGSPIYQLEGTSAGDRDPAIRPAQASQPAPMVGGALRVGGWPGPTARLAYRRTWSATADRRPGEPRWGVNEEKLALTAEAGWRRRVFGWAAARYNLLVTAFDDQQAGVRVRVSPRQTVHAEHAYLAPTFDGDSIWNVFAAGAYRDLRAGYDVDLGAGIAAHARAFYRIFEDDGTAWGGTAGAVKRRPGSVVRADLYLDGGHGGRKLGGDVAARLPLGGGGRFEAEGRLTGYGWRPDARPDDSTIVVLGAQVGGLYRAAPGMDVHIVVEDNAGTRYRSQWRALVLVDLQVSP